MKYAVSILSALFLLVAFQNCSQSFAPLTNSISGDASLGSSASSPTPSLSPTPTVSPTVTPTTTPVSAWWKPAPGLSWDIQYSGTINFNTTVKVFNIDLFDSSADNIDALKSRGVKVICYFSAGSYEDWRPDIASFPASILGNDLDGWPGEKWLDVRQVEVLRGIMGARMDLAVQKKCDAVDPDNVDGYTNSPGFPMKAADQLVYNKMLASEAHKRGLAVSLKNDLDQIPDLVDGVDFAVNESCNQYDECDTLLPFVKAGKPVYGIEYTGATSKFCPAMNADNFDFIKKDLDLDQTVEPCR